MKNDKAYELITNRIISEMEKGLIPWHKPWAGAQGHAASLATKKPYRGVNAFLLNMAPYSSPFWLTFRQTKALGGSIKKGEKSWPCVFWKILKFKEKNEAGEEKIKSVPLLKYYNVFNVEQCEGLDMSKVPQIEEIDRYEHNPIEAAEVIVEGMPNRPTIQHFGNEASYSPTMDRVKMPKADQFETPESYYSTLFHELTHSTGHKSRVHRKALDKPAFFADETYSKEELVAELGAAFLCNHCEIIDRTVNNSTAYLQGWLKVLRADKKMIVQAAAAAQKAADYILGVTFTNND